jgi:hypothetical protein
MIYPIDLDELVARAVSADDRHRRPVHAHPLCEESSERLVRSPLGRRCRDAQGEDPVSDPY